MRRLLKILIVLVILILITVTAAFFALNHYLTPTKVKQLLTTQVDQHSDMTLSINGDIQWGIYPHITLKANEFTLVNKNNPKEKISVGKVNISIKLLPLLKQEIQPSEFDLADISYANGSGQPIILDSATLKAPSMSLNKAFPLDLHAILHSGENKADIKLTADTLIADDFNHIQLNKYKLNLNGNVVTGKLAISGFNSADATTPITQTLTINGTVNSDKLTVENITISKLQSTIDVKNGVYTIDPIQAIFYDGKITGSAQVNLQKNTPRIKAKLNATGINAATLLKAVAGQDYMEGTISLNSDLSTRGSDQVTLTKNLNGTVSANVHNGKITKLDINQAISQALVLLNKGRADSTLNKPITFDAITSNTTFTNGVGKLKAKLASKTLTGNAKGKLNLNTQYAKIDLNARYLKSKKTKNLVIPMHISGKFTDLDISLDKDELTQQIFAQHKDSLQQQLIESAGSGKIDLSRLFG